MAARYDIPTAMRAWTHLTPGEPANVLALRNDIPVPTLKPTPNGSVLVHISHTALNPGGSIMMQLAPSFIRTKPCIPEMDFAGTIVKVSEDYPLSTGKVRVNMQVFGSVPVGEHMMGSGSLAEYVAVGAGFVVPLPEGMKMEEAAGLGIAGCTALKLLDAAKPTEGARILVNAAGGGIGCSILQMVRRAVGTTGRVVAMCSGEKEELVKRLGADEVGISK
jgi:reticulon-4-interacting protein 1, mitochondrial